MQQTINSFVGIIILIIVATGASFLMHRSVKHFPQFTFPVYAYVRVPIVDITTFTTKTITDETNYATIDVKYPVFSNTPVAFNKQIETLLNEQIKNHKKLSQENWQARIDTAPQGQKIARYPAKADRFPFYADFQVVQSNDAYVSVLVKYGAFQGGAHGFETQVSYNYDVKNNKTLTLGDLFPNDTNYLMTVSAFAKKELLKQFTKDLKATDFDSERALQEYIDQNIVSMLNPGIDPAVPDNFKTFTFTKDTITFYFQQYQVAAYAYGEPTVVMPRVK